jgi:hypothetical protein
MKMMGKGMSNKMNMVMKEIKKMMGNKKSSMMSMVMKYLRRKLKLI